MSNNIRTLIYKINSLCDATDFAAARKLVEYNFNRFNDPTYVDMLNNNASSLLRHIRNEKNKDTKHTSLSRLDMLTIASINKYCYSFDIALLKHTIKTSASLIQRPDAQKLLSDNAKYLLKTMGVILSGKTLEMEEAVK